MRSKTKIVVLHMKELIYTGLFLLLGILLIVLLIIMFFPQKNSSSSESAVNSTYTPGVYTASLILNNSAVDIEVVVNEDSITSVRLVNLDDAVTTMYPLIEPALSEIAEQIYETQDLSAIQYSDDNRYTSTVLLEAINNALQKASLNQVPSEE